jgi:UDP-galactopyranose mutase
MVGGKQYRFPINRDMLKQLYGLELREANVVAFFERVREPSEPALISGDRALNSVGRNLTPMPFGMMTACSASRPRI